MLLRSVGLSPVLFFYSSLHLYYECRLYYLQLLICKCRQQHCDNIVNQIIFCHITYLTFRCLWKLNMLYLIHKRITIYIGLWSGLVYRFLLFICRLFLIQCSVFGFCFTISIALSIPF